MSMEYSLHLDDPSHELTNIMTREIYVLREILTNIEEEKFALLQYNLPFIKVLIPKRHILFELLSKYRKRRREFLNTLTPISCEFNILNSQINDLTDQIKAQSIYNERLGKQKIPIQQPNLKNKYSKARVALLQKFPQED